MTRMYRIGSNRVLVGIALGCAVAGTIAIGLPREMGWIRFLSAVILGIPAGFALNWVWRLVRTRWKELAIWARICIFAGSFFVALTINYLVTIRDRAERSDNVVVICLTFLLWGAFLVFSALVDRLWTGTARR